MIRRPPVPVTDADAAKVQQLRDALNPLMAQLIELQTLAGISNAVSNAARAVPQQPDELMPDWDFSENAITPLALSPALESTPARPAATLEDPSLPQPVEWQTLYLPSNRNVLPCPADVELSLRKEQAQTHIRQLRELIADKSFQYSHVIRVAPRKSIKTKGRATVKGLNVQIAFHCYMYRHCRSRLISLGADRATLQQFPELKQEDIKASTAILAPNIAGSTTLQLSWIWNDVRPHITAGGDAEAAPPAAENPANSATIFECKLCLFAIQIHSLTLFSQAGPLAAGPGTTQPVA